MNSMLISTGHARYLACALALLLLPGVALAELMLNPTRVVFAKNQRAVQVELINDGSVPTTYRISLVNRRMTETGEFLPVQTPADGELFADALLTFSPRQVTLQPGTAQVVRVMVRKPDGLASGEYRSHLHFEKMADAQGATNVEQQAGAEGQVGVVLNALVGASIPVIVRHQTGDASVKLSQLTMRPGAAGQAPVLGFQIERGGDISVYGDLSASLVVPGRPDHVLGKAAGVAVYTPNPVRRVGLALNLPAAAAPLRGTLRLSYRERAEAGGKLLAEAELALP